MTRLSHEIETRSIRTMALVMLCVALGCCLALTACGSSSDEGDSNAADSSDATVAVDDGGDFASEAEAPAAEGTEAGSDSAEVPAAEDGGETEPLDATVPDDASYRHVSGAEVQQMLQDNPDCVLVDVRVQLAYDYEHIPGAICIPLEELPAKAPEMLPDKDQAIILYCDYGGVSKIAAEDMVDMGYTNIIEFDGLADWPGETIRDESIQ